MDGIAQIFSVFASELYRDYDQNLQSFELIFNPCKGVDHL